MVACEVSLWYRAPAGDGHHYDGWCALEGETWLPVRHAGPAAAAALGALLETHHRSDVSRPLRVTVLVLIEQET